MKKIILGIIALLVFTGCTSEIEVICDKQKNIEYIFVNQGYRSGFNVRYDTDGFISKCEKGI